MDSLNRQVRTLLIMLTAVLTAGVFGGAVLAQKQGAGTSGAANVVEGTLTDVRDGKTYRTVRIVGKTWMAENLNYEPRNGGAWCYENKEANCGKYGRLYDYKTAYTACPAGYHLPSRAEWDKLCQATGSKKDFEKDGLMIYWLSAGTKLKARAGWDYDDDRKRNGGGTDNFGFTALPGGIGSRWIFEGKVNEYWEKIGKKGCWWSGQANDGLVGKRGRCMGYNYDGVDEDARSFGLSLRCVKD